MEAERRFEPWPFALVALLAAGIGACLTFWSLAVRYPDGEVVDDAYLAGLAVNEERRADRRAEALGLEVFLVARPAGEGMDVEVRVQRADGSAAPARAVALRRERPAEGALDADFELTPAVAAASPPSAFVGRVPLPRAGRWHLIATAWIGDERVRRVFEVHRAGAELPGRGG